jgi:hypothetical protein
VPGFELFAMLGFGDFQGMLRGAVIWWLGSGVVDWWNENRSVPYVSSTRRVFFFVCCQFCSIQVRHVAYLLHFGLESFRIGSSV